MSRPLSTTMWCPAVKVGKRWKFLPWYSSASRRGAKQRFLDSYYGNDFGLEVKFVKVRIKEVKGAGYQPSKGGKK